MWRFDEMECRRIMKELEKYPNTQLTYNDVLGAVKALLERDIKACAQCGFLKLCNFGEKLVRIDLIKNALLMLIKTHTDR